jgi:uncharacterized protein (TIGR02679 family)
MDKKQRLQKLFANPDIQWIRERLRERVRQGKGFDGKISLASPTGSQMAAFADLTGRRSRNRKRLSLPLQELESILHEAELADDLEEAVFLLEGSVANEKQRREGLRQEWQTLFERARSESEKSPKVIQWLEMLERSGLLKRLSLSDLQNAQQLLDQAFALHARLPAQQVELPALAAQITGDSHALDYGKPLAGVILPLLASLHDIDHWQNPADRRKVWDANGILCDSLSNPVLVCNLRLTASHPLAPILETNYQHEEPSYLTLRQLLNFPIKDMEACRFSKVFVCENPAIVSANIEANGRNSHPLICLSGNPTSSAQKLLSQLSQVGVDIHYHGDFDWPGLRIAKFVIETFGAKPWRMDAMSYLDAADGIPLKGKPAVSPWDTNLKEAMLVRGTAVYEEQVAKSLLADLSFE